MSSIKKEPNSEEEEIDDCYDEIGDSEEEANFEDSTLSFSSASDLADSSPIRGRGSRRRSSLPAGSPKVQSLIWVCDIDMETWPPPYVLVSISCAAIRN